MTSMLNGLSRRRLSVLAGGVTVTVTASPVTPTGPGTLTTLTTLMGLTIHTSLTTPTDLIIHTGPTTHTGRIIRTGRIIPTKATHTGRVVALVVQSTLPVPLSSFRFPIVLYSFTPTVHSPMVESSSTRMIPIR